MKALQLSKLLLVIAVLASIAHPAYAYDRRSDRHRDRHYRDHHSQAYYRYPPHYSPRYPYGKVFVTLPFGYVKLVLGGKRYYYCDGVYYNRRGPQYVVVAPPPERDVIVINNVRDEDSSLRTGKTSSQNVDVTIRDNFYTVKIPDGSGGYKSVDLKRSDDGFIGPQGEYYEDFPDSAQLQKVYGRP